MSVVQQVNLYLPLALMDNENTALSIKSRILSIFFQNKVDLAQDLRVATNEQWEMHCKESDYIKENRRKIA